MSTLGYAIPARALSGANAGEFAGRGWRAYLVLAVLLVPFTMPAGPAQLAVLDLVNLPAMALFFALAAARRTRVVLPFTLPVLLIGTGSLLAVTNAVSVGASALALAQDAYLYLWFVALAAILSRQRSLVPVAFAWLLAADVSSLVCVWQAAAAGVFPRELLAAEGFRPRGTFYGANMCADYLMLSVFVALSLTGRAPRLLVWGSIALLLVALLVTKSNGSLIALVVGAGATVLAWAMRGEGSRTRRAGTLALLAAAAVLAYGAYAQWDVGAGVKSAGHASVLGRMDKSSASRKVIWRTLGSQLARQPLGIGPGNSVLQSMPIGRRVRPGTSFQAKEAHSDYFAYAIERGPIGLLGQVLWVFAGFLLVLGVAGPPLAGAGRTLDASAARHLEWLRAVFVGGLVASAVHSTVIEKLHFRHYWLYLALAFASTAAAAFRPSGVPSEERAR
jgi:hypothetical protein